MKNRRFVLHLIVGLLTFLIGLTAAVALGGFDPMARFTRRHHGYRLTIPPHSLSGDSDAPRCSHGSRKERPRAAELRYSNKSLTPPPPPPVAPPAAPFQTESEMVTPPAAPVPPAR